MREATVIVVCLLCFVGRSMSAPGRSADEVLIGEVDIAMGDDGVGSDDSPEATSPEPFTKNCIVDNKAYSHSQMIPSQDQSSHCLCVAGEVYCWWQTYGGPTTVAAMAPKAVYDDSSTTEEDDYSSEGQSESPEASGESSGEQDDNSEELTDSSEEEDEEDEEEEEEEESNDLPEASLGNSTTTTTRTTTSRAPATCLVMGRRYQEGEILPHSTGNCVECSCGPEGRIECSPRDCVGLRPQSPGGGDLELFDRGIEGTF